MARYYTLRDINEELWRRVKSKAAAEGRTVKAVIEGLLGAWSAAPGPGPGQDARPGPARTRTRT